MSRIAKTRNASAKANNQSNKQNSTHCVRTTYIFGRWVYGHKVKRKEKRKKQPAVNIDDENKNVTKELTQSTQNKENMDYRLATELSDAGTF